MKKAVAISAALICTAILGVYIFFTFKPTKLQGSESVYNTITLQLSDNMFYDVRVPVEAKLLSTDGATVYTYDLLSIGVQDKEPSSFCKVQVGGRWVFASSEDGWLKATIKGFQDEQPYEGSYSLDNMQWTASLPDVVVSIEDIELEKLLDGNSKALGGTDFVTTQVAFGTFDVATKRALTKMATLYKQPLRFGMKTDYDMWVASGDYTVAVHSINYNTCVVISACGEIGRQYAAALLRRKEA